LAGNRPPKIKDRFYFKIQKSLTLAGGAGIWGGNIGRAPAVVRLHEPGSSDAQKKGGGAGRQPQNSSISNLQVLPNSKKLNAVKEETKR
jgi:hypothetical protein